MSKIRNSYRCTACGATTPKWLGRCPSCQAWGSIEEAPHQSGKAGGVRTSTKVAAPVRSARRVGDIGLDRHARRATGVGELDRVLGGGMVRGGVVLLAGEPGAGKSTLTLGVANQIAAQGSQVLYVSGEESAEQIKMRADRIGAGSENLFIASETDLSVVLGQIEEVGPDLLIVDSLQTVASPDVEGRTGGVAQVVEVATVLSRVAKARGMCLIIIGQVTKDGSIAGPRIVEHLVDVVLSFEGDRHSPLRLLRGVKNRYGPEEVGCFEQTPVGVLEVPDPSRLFVGERPEPVPGTCVTVILEGIRPMLAEVQALVAPTQIPVPRRGVSGLDSSRLNMLTAVTGRHGKVRLHDKDLFCATVGGMRVTEPCADLSIVLAIVSAATEVPFRPDTLALGEVALSGDVRRVADIERRLGEAARLGFKTALVPPHTKNRFKDGRPPLTLVEVDHVRRAVAAVAAMADGAGRE